MGKIHGLSTPPDLPFCLSSSKTYKQSPWKRFENNMDTHNWKPLLSLLHIWIDCNDSIITLEMFQCTTLYHTTHNSINIVWHTLLLTSFQYKHTCICYILGVSITEHMKSTQASMWTTMKSFLTISLSLLSSLNLIISIPMNNDVDAIHLAHLSFDYIYIYIYIYIIVSFNMTKCKRIMWS